MSDDFGTINVSQAERSREIEVIRQHYRHHRESLESMIADAPTEHLASEYRRLVHDIDASLVKLDELGLQSPPDAPPPPDRDPGLRPLVTTNLPESDLEPRSRLPLILVIALVALAGIGWLIWRASSDRPIDSAVIEDTAATSATTASATTSTRAPVAAALTVAPPTHDYGVIRKGTRATRQFEVANHTDKLITIDLARSTCRCLFYEYQASIGPKQKESVTVTVDGARAKAGELRENIRVSAKSDPAVGTSFDVIATIQ